MKTRTGLLGAIAAAFAIFGCLPGGNSGSETTNGLAGTVRDREGRPVAGARVRLLPADFDPGISAAPPSAITGRDGGYALSGLAPGLYNLEASDSAMDGLSLVKDVSVPAAGDAHADGTLEVPGSVSVRVSDFAGSGDTGYLYIPGTGAFAPVGAAAIRAGQATLSPVPPGRFDSLVLVILSGGARSKELLAQGIEVASGAATVSAAFQAWSHSRDLPIDTKAMGIAKDVEDFPLLVRLTSADFDFGQAAAHGEDLRFADSAGRPLPFRIGRWDPAEGRAEAWVRLDTIRANHAGQHIRMHWGKAGAKGDATGPEVFAPEALFATVYHLDEAGNADAGGYRDATPNGNHATAAGINPEARVPGVIGWAKGFAGTASSSPGTLTAAVPKGFGGNGSFTVSFWLRYQRLPQRQDILDFGTYGLGQDMHFLLQPDTSIQFGAYDKNSTGAPAPWHSLIKLPQALARWTHLATVYDAGKASLEVYVDGERADSLAAPAMAIDAAGALRIGQAIWTAKVPLEESPFNGALDELRFETRALGPERIKLDYLTQKP